MQNNVSTENVGAFRVVRLQASNVKRLRAVDITPDPDAPLIVIGGNNGEGKSSTLDAIMYALGGKDAVCADPIRHGQTKASVTVDLGRYIATRRFTPTGHTLTLKTKEGLNVPSPQGTLDGILGALTFDPLAFSRMAPAKRLATLISLVKLDIDLSDLATKRKTLYDSRTEANRRRHDYEGELRQAPEPDASLPKEKIDLGVLIAEKNRLDGVIRENAASRMRIESLQDELRRHDEAIAKLEERLTLEKEERAKVKSQLELRISEVTDRVDPDTSIIDAQIQDASDLNTKIERAAQYRERAKKLGTLTTAVDQLTEQIETLDKTKENALSRAQFPIPGLCFADGDVSFAGTLFDQLSSAEQTKVSLAMAMAMNPALRVIMIRDGSLLDETSLGIIREMAQTRGYQIWLEVVGNRNDATVIIEDGAVVGAEETEPETEVVS